MAKKGVGESSSVTSVEVDYKRYIPLHKDILKGDWNSIRVFIEADPRAPTAPITDQMETALHVAVGTGKSLDIVEQLVNLMSPEALAKQDSDGDTALHIAGRIGNTRAARILVERHRDLQYTINNDNLLPVHNAAINAHKDTLSYLLGVMDHDDHRVDTQHRSRLLVNTIGSQFYDVALMLVNRYPEAATTKLIGSDNFALKQIAQAAFAFPSGHRLIIQVGIASLTLNLHLQRLIYLYVPVQLEIYAQDRNEGDIENPAQIAQVPHWARFLAKIFTPVPLIKRIQQQKLMNLHALQLVKRLCRETHSIDDYVTRRSLYEPPLLKAARLGIPEIIEEIVESFPSAVWTKDSSDWNIFHLAIINRCESVFNLIYQMSEQKQYLRKFKDKSDNTILHLAGRLAPAEKLNLISGAALQMQRELQWFEEVKKLSNPIDCYLKNDAGETPAMVFTREHKELLVEGGKWMRETANSCSIVAALIVTIVFAAAITFPGGNDGISGLPIFSKNIAFIIFAVSDAISLFTSSTSLLMFLSILTSRFAEGDFLYILPTRLINGLLTLFLSITTMIIPFSSTIYLLFSHNHKKAWIIIPIFAFSILPISSFVFLQFPLLRDLISLTYGTGIFGKQSDRPFY